MAGKIFSYEAGKTAYSMPNYSICTSKRSDSSIAH